MYLLVKTYSHSNDVSEVKDYDELLRRVASYGHNSVEVYEVATKLNTKELTAEYNKKKVLAESKLTESDKKLLGIR